MEGRAGEGNGESSKWWNPYFLAKSPPSGLKDGVVGVDDWVRRKAVVGRTWRDIIMVDRLGSHHTRCVECSSKERQCTVQTFIHHGQSSEPM